MNVLGIVFAILLGLVGLFMSGCGGLFLFGELFSSQRMGLWVITLPCTLAGAGLIWAAVALFRNARRNTGNNQDNR